VMLKTYIQDQRQPCPLALVEANPVIYGISEFVYSSRPDTTITLVSTRNLTMVAFRCSAKLAEPSVAALP
jgi:hypothetical protein